MTGELIRKLAMPHRPRCCWWRRDHAWRLVGRRTSEVSILGRSQTVYVLRFECPRCSDRTVLNTLDVDVLWQLRLEVPRPEAVGGG